MLRYAYFPGCSMETTGTTYRLSIEYVAKKIGLELMEIPDWNCCGASSAHAKGKWLSLALPARNIGIAEKRLPGLDICVCPVQPAIPVCSPAPRHCVRAKKTEQKSLRSLKWMSRVLQRF